MVFQTDLTSVCEMWHNVIFATVSEVPRITETAWWESCLRLCRPLVLIPKRKAISLGGKPSHWEGQVTSGHSLSQVETTGPLHFCQLPEKVARSYYYQKIKQRLLVTFHMTETTS